MMELFVLLNSSELTVSVCNNREKKLKDLEVIKDISKVLFLCAAELVEVSFNLNKFSCAGSVFVQG